MRGPNCNSLQIHVIDLKPKRRVKSLSGGVSIWHLVLDLTLMKKFRTLRAQRIDDLMYQQGINH
jgi:hypothetical protein